MACPHDALTAFECDGVHIPPADLCRDCALDWIGWHESRGLDPDTYSASAHGSLNAPPCAGFQSPSPKLAPFKPGEDPLSDKTRSTLGRLFGGDITE